MGAADTSYGLDLVITYLLRTNWREGGRYSVFKLKILTKKLNKMLQTLDVHRNGDVAIVNSKGQVVSYRNTSAQVCEARRPRRGGGGAQPQHTNYWAPQTRKRHQQEHRPQRPTERSAPTQHAKGRTGDCPGPRKETTTPRNVTQGMCHKGQTSTAG